MPSGVRLLGAAYSQARASVAGLDQRVDVRPWLITSGAPRPVSVAAPSGEEVHSLDVFATGELSPGLLGESLPWSDGTVAFRRLERQRLID